jgi:hypothetical protein
LIHKIASTILILYTTTVFGLGCASIRLHDRIPSSTPPIVDESNASDLDAKNSAYLKHELAQVLSCNYPDTSFSSSQERLNFITKNSIDVSSGNGQFSKNRFDGSARFTSAAGNGQIRFSEWTNNGADPKCALSFATEKGASVSIQGIPDEKIAFPPQEIIKDPNLMDLYSKLKLGSMTCSIAPNDPLIFDSDDFKETVHLIVHPHDYYDTQGKITAEINFWQAQPGVRSIALLETIGPRTSEEIIGGVPFKLDASKLTFTPRLMECLILMAIKNFLVILF